jgi:FtsP/CotA-like multicopper oxidase with cupredoxin domain
MNSKTIRKLKSIIFVGLIALAMMASSAFGATYNLRAGATTMAMPDGEIIIMWGFADIDGDNEPKIPGPRLMVPAGEGLTVSLTNDLPVPVSIIVPGQTPPLVVPPGDSEPERNLDGRIRSFTRETPAAGGPVSYTWPSIKPGTYLYHSGTHPAVQVQMGLYGAVTNDAVDAPAEAYPGIGYDAEALIIYSEIDPALHAAVVGGTYGTPMYPSTIDYQPKYFLVNGEPSDATAPVAEATPGSNVLVRLLNAGLKDHAPEILGSHLSVIAEDGNLYPYARQHYSMVLPAGKTLDALLIAPVEGEYPIFDRRLYRTNDASVEGPMYTKISVAP